MRSLTEYALLIAARLLSAGAGYVVLAYSANKLQPGVFGELAFYQSLQFLATVLFDAGIVQAATRRAAGAPNLLQVAKEYQSIRTLLHALAALLIFGVASLRTSASDPLLAVGCAIAVFSNLLNTDWLLIAAGLRKKWAQKATIVGLSNVIFTVFLFALLEGPSAVLLGQATANGAGAVFLAVNRLLSLGWPRLPSSQQLRDAAALSSANIATHTAYSLPLLVAAAFAPPLVAGSFACMFRIFSASALFVPITTDFAAARMIAERRGSTSQEAKPARGLAFLLASCLLAVLPFLLAPNDVLLRAFGAAIDLQKYGISSSDFLMYKLVLLLYCLDFGAQRYAFVLADNRALLLATGGGLLLCGLATIWTLNADFASATSWFIPLLMFQSFTALLAAGLAVRNPRRSTVRPEYSRRGDGPH